MFKRRDSFWPHRLTQHLFRISICLVLLAAVSPLSVRAGNGSGTDADKLPESPVAQPSEAVKPVPT
jgi:hypothetical protein